jgi:hypothetical protein
MPLSRRLSRQAQAAQSGGDLMGARESIDSPVPEESASDAGDRMSAASLDRARSLHALHTFVSATNGDIAPVREGDRDEEEDDEDDVKTESDHGRSPANPGVRKSFRDDEHASERGSFVEDGASTRDSVADASEDEE